MEIERSVALASDNAALRPEPAAGRGALPAIAAVLIFAAFSSYCAIRSEGFITGDACVHYFSARYAFSHPRIFVDVWDRPVVTILNAGPAWIAGREGIRIVSMLVAIGCGLVSMRIASRQGLRFPALALIFTLGQPLLFLHSFSEMTELPFALLLGLAFAAWQEKRFWLATIFISLTPPARPEGFGMVAVMAMGLLVTRNWKQIFVLPVPVIIWDLAGWLMSDHRSPWWRWLKDSWPYAGESMYGSGALLTFVAFLPIVVSPFVLPALFLGIWRSFASPKSDFAADSQPASERADGRHQRLCVILTAAIPLFVLTVHSLLYWLGKMSSAGEGRYLIVVAPFWGVLAARGWEWAFARFQLRRILLAAASAVVLPPVIANAIFPAVPIPFAHDWQSARRISAWYQASPLRESHPKITTSHPGVYYFLEINPYTSPHVADWGKDTLHARPADTVLIWDPIFGPRNASAELTMELDEIRRNGWVEVTTIPDLAEVESDYYGHSPPDDAKHRWHVFVTGEERR